MIVRSDRPTVLLQAQPRVTMARPPARGNLGSPANATHAAAATPPAVQNLHPVSEAGPRRGSFLRRIRRQYVERRVILVTKNTVAALIVGVALGFVSATAWNLVIWITSEAIRR